MAFIYYIFCRCCAPGRRPRRRPRAADDGRRRRGVRGSQIVPRFQPRQTAASRAQSSEAAAAATEAVAADAIDRSRRRQERDRRPSGRQPDRRLDRERQLVIRVFARAVRRVQRNVVLGLSYRIL